MKISLYTISYLGIWYDGPAVPLRKLIPKAAQMGFDGITIDCKGQHGLLGDLASKKARGEVRQLAESEEIELAAVETVSNFMSPILEAREANLVWVREQMHAARDLEVDLVKLFAGWMGTSRRGGHGWYDMLYQHELPYATDVERWGWVKDALKDAAKWAEDLGLTTVIQNHGPPVRRGYEDTLALVKEVNMDNVKMSLDIGIGCFDPVTQQSDEYINQAVKECRDFIALTHYNGAFRKRGRNEYIQIPCEAGGYTPPGGVTINYPAFVTALKRNGFKGHIAYEECSPVLINHEGGGLSEVDRRVEAALGYMKRLNSAQAGKR